MRINRFTGDDKIREINLIRSFNFHRIFLVLKFLITEKNVVFIKCKYKQNGDYTIVWM